MVKNQYFNSNVETTHSCVIDNTDGQHSDQLVMSLNIFTALKLQQLLPGDMEAFQTRDVFG